MMSNSRDGKDHNNRDLLRKMLESQPDVEQRGDDFIPREAVSLELLVRAGGGAPAPLSRVESIALHDDFVTVRSAEAATLLPYAVIVGLRVIQHAKARGPGFTR